MSNRNARKESVRLTPFRDSTTQYNSPQYTAVLRILRRTARSAAEIAERTATQHWGPEMENRRRGGPRSGVGWPWPPAGHFCSDADQTCSHAHDPHRAHADGKLRVSGCARTADPVCSSVCLALSLSGLILCAVQRSRLGCRRSQQESACARTKVLNNRLCLSEKLQISALSSVQSSHCLCCFA